MLVLNDFRDHNPTKPYACLTIGNFDGVHLGHQALLRKVVQSTTADSAVMFFWPHPKQILTGQMDAVLSVASQRVRWFAELGLSACIQQHFDQDFAQIEAETFLESIHQHLSFEHLWIGYDFRFGKGGVGNYDLAINLGQRLGFEAHQIEAIEASGQPISSSRIRGLLADGKLLEANQLLGRTWSLLGDVHPGAGRGAGLGFPTVNIGYNHPILVPDGVYGGVISSPVIGKRIAAISVGTNPTFGADPRHVEAFVLGHDGSKIEGEIELFFHTFIRDQIKYDELKDLTRQIKLDVDQVEQLAAEQSWIS